MILITLGTQDKKFDRLLKRIDKLIKKKIIKDKVVVVSGCDTYKSKNMEIIKLLPKNEFEEMVRKSKFIITHGGVGSILTALSYDKKVIAVPRLKEFNEAANDHQIQLIENFTKEGYILDAINLDDLEDRIKKVDKFIPNKYIYTYEKTVSKIDKEISKTNNRKVIILIRLTLFFIIVILLILLIFRII